MEEARSVLDEDIDEVLSADLPWEELAGCRVLVTGAAGFLSSHMVATLLRLNDCGLSKPVSCVAVVRDARRTLPRLARYAGRPDLEIVEHDLASPMPPPVRDVHYVIHAASQASPRHYDVDPVGTLAPNTLGTHALLGLAHEQDARRFLFFSSGEVYGTVTQVPTPEDVYGPVDPMWHRNCYAEGKRAGEAMCAAWAHQRGIHAMVVRPFHTYGPGLDLNDGRVFADFVSDVVHGRDIVLRTTGEARRAFCYTADATAGFFTVLLQGERGVAYNVGNPDAEISIRDLADLIAGLFPDRGLKVRHEARPAHDGYAQSRITRNAPDISRARALGWEPRVDLATGFRRTITSFLTDSVEGKSTG